MCSWARCQVSLTWRMGRCHLIQHPNRFCFNRQADSRIYGATQRNNQRNVGRRQSWRTHTDFKSPPEGGSGMGGGGDQWGRTGSRAEPRCMPPISHKAAGQLISVDRGWSFQQAEPQRLDIHLPTRRTSLHAPHLIQKPTQGASSCPTVNPAAAKLLEAPSGLSGDGSLRSHETQKKNGIWSFVMLTAFCVSPLA